ncbi:polysaccharide deacetylase family protein [Streptacidiphilus sp. N1-12]|uniref:Polysaccharide deacetylase family protein n=2 Tax=Streptacidiphilus alkalitolerans TaxID=3342712 RepID=A0ABV6XAN1_9ACTN
MAAEPLQRERRLTRRPHGGRARRNLPYGGPEIFPDEAPWILMYHSVDAYRSDPYQVTVTPERFARQMAWLSSRGLRGVALDELLRAHAVGRSAGLVGLTFDDGYADLPREVLPVLERFGFTATAYVVVGRLGEHNVWDRGPRKRLLSRDQVLGLVGSRVEIGSHGLLHRSLPSLTDQELLQETRDSREQLEDLVGRRVTGFCYPYGALDRRVVEAVRASGYGYATAIAHSPLTGRWALPRSYVGERDNGWRLRAKQARHRMRGLRCRTDEERAR